MSGKQVLAKSPSTVHGKHCVQFVFALYCLSPSTYIQNLHGEKKAQLAGAREGKINCPSCVGPARYVRTYYVVWLESLNAKRFSPLAHGVHSRPTAGRSAPPVTLNKGVSGGGLPQCTSDGRGPRRKKRKIDFFGTKQRPTSFDGREKVSQSDFEGGGGDFFWRIK